MRKAWQEKLEKIRADRDRWLSTHPRVKRALDYSGCLLSDRHAIARGVAAGLFVALLPVFGIQTVVLVGVCMLLRANFPVAFVVSWISNPFTIGPVVLAANYVGTEILAPLFPELRQAAAEQGEAAQTVIVTFTGGLLIATPIAALGYLATIALRRRKQ